MNATINNESGKIVFSDAALKNLIGVMVSESYGIVGMSSKGDGIVELLKRDSVSKGVKLTIDESTVSVQLNVIVKYGVSIKTVAQNIIDNVKFSLNELTSLTVGDIDVVVQSIRV